MKKLLHLKQIASCFALAGVLLMQACSDDEIFDVMGSTENKVYIHTQSWSPIDAPKNSVVFNITNTPAGSIIANADKIEVKFGVQCTHPAANDILVKFEVDNSLPTEGYQGLPSGVALLIDKTEIVIPRGATKSSDSITVSIGSEHLHLFSAGQYIAPLKISSVTNAKLSDNLSSAFLLVKAAFTNCLDQATSVPGTAAERTGWMAKVNGGDQGNKLFDDNRRTYFLGDNFTIEVDLGAVYENITGLKLDFYAWYYAMGTANIYTSATSENDYELQGTPSFPGSTPQYVRFYAPVSARYIKVEITSPSYSSDYGSAVTEFNLYQE
ncbi:MAG: DUF1735 domain-containing protein [Mangrovibacterium sp.]|nr:DUF1735 domain-containing protein [Mangrovibacterium sp.]